MSATAPSASVAPSTHRVASSFRSAIPWRVTIRTVAATPSKAASPSEYQSVNFVRNASAIVIQGAPLNQARLDSALAERLNHVRLDSGLVRGREPGAQVPYLNGRQLREEGTSVLSKRTTTERACFQGLLL